MEENTKRDIKKKTKVETSLERQTEKHQPKKIHAKKYK